MPELSTKDLLLKTPANFSKEELQPFAEVMQRIYDHFRGKPEDIEALKADLQALPGAALLTGEVAEFSEAANGLSSIHNFIENCGANKPEDVRQLHAAVDQAIVAYRESLLGKDPRDTHFMGR